MSAQRSPDSLSPSSSSSSSSSPSLSVNCTYSWFRQDPYFAAFSHRSLLDNIMHHQQEANNIKQSFNCRILRLVGTQNPFELFLNLEQMKKQWFYAQDTRQISKRKKFLQYVLETHLLERIYPKLEGKIDLIRMIINIYRQIQQEAFGIVLINQNNQVFLVQNEKYYWSFPKGKLKLNPSTYSFESQWSCALREFHEEVNVDLSDWSPSQYWEARLPDQRKVGLFIIENFDETKVQFDFDKREIIDTMWFNLSRNHDDMHTLRQYWKEEQRLSDPFYTALPFIEHLIFEYLPHKQQYRLPTFISKEKAKSNKFSSSSSHNSVIDMLLGRAPVSCSSSSSSSSLFNVSSKNASLQSFNLLQQKLEKKQSFDNVETDLNSMNILDRLNEANRQAQYHDHTDRTNDTQHPIAVQA